MANYFGKEKVSMSNIKELFKYLHGGGAQALRKALGLGDTLGVLPIANGGTGGTVKTDDTQIYNYVSGDAVSSLSGNEVVFASNLLRLKDAFNVYGKQVLSVLCEWECDYQWLQGNTWNVRSCAGFSIPTKEIHNNNLLMPSSNTLAIGSTCNVSGTYQVNLKFNFIPRNLVDNCYVAYKLAIDSEVLFSKNRIDIGTESKTFSFSEVVNIKQGDAIQILQAEDPNPGYPGNASVDLKIVRVS